jgi:adenylylsulfate kinase
MNPGKLNLTAESFAVSRQQKEGLNGHRSFTLWLTGLSASGKSTIARYLEERLHKDGIRTFMLDGDNTRMGINKDLDFSPEGRKENIRRVAEIAKLMNDAGIVVIACFISPMVIDRAMAKQIIGENSFIEVFVDASLDVCKERDPKGLYKKAIAGEIKEFTGISAPYEAPLAADIHIETNIISAIRSSGEVYEWLKLKKYLLPADL